MRLALRHHLGAALLCGAGALHAADHVLVMTISDYVRSPLAGVRHDADNALQLAARLGYDTRRATVLKDRELTGAGMRAAMAKLAARVQQNDRVFVYYSGHGYSLAQGGSCVQGLVAQDETLIATAELNLQFDAIKSRVSDALVIFDACHSGGNRDMTVTRSLERERDGAPLRAKVWTPRGGERCEMPVNELAKAWAPADTQGVTRAAVFPKSNFTFIAAAAEREVALDNRERGGLATLGLLQCAHDGVPSSSGLVTAQDLAACAQGHVAHGVKAINDQLARKQYSPHQVGVYGNAQKFFDLKSLPAPMPAPVNQLAATTPDVANLALASFRQFAANSNGNWGLGVEPSAAAAPLGQSVRVKYQTTQIGYAQLFYVGSDRRDISRVWPTPGQTRLLMASEGQLPISLELAAPAGENTFMLVVSQTPLDLDSVLHGGSAQINAQTLQQMGCAFMKQRNAVVREDAPDSSACQGDQPNGATPAGAVGGYAARLFTVRGL